MLHNNTHGAAQYLGEHFETFCPGIRQLPILQDKMNIGSLNGIDRIFNKLLDVTNMQLSIDYAHNAVTVFNEYTDIFASYKWVLPLVVGLCTCCAFFFIADASFMLMDKNEGKFECILMTIILPLFVILSTILIALIAIFGILVTMNAGELN